MPKIKTKTERREMSKWKFTHKIEERPSAAEKRKNCRRKEWMDGRMGRQTDGRMDGQSEGREDRRTDGREDKRTKKKKGRIKRRPDRRTNGKM